jgi:enoyl-CoA hydratase/3-hydroxyacyl-CoA dehydrogenase
VDDLDGVKVLTIRRPQALNALSDEVNDELLAVIRAHEGDPDVAGFVITGYGPKAFSAGADIGRFPRVLGRADAAITYSRDCSRLLVHLDAMEKPVVAALNGMALGGGLELALRCRSIVATRSAWLQFPEVTLGIVPGIGGLVVPYRRWPQAAAVFHDMIRVARRLGAEQAHALGLLDALASDSQALVREAVARVRDLAGAPRPSLDGAVDVPAPGPLEAVVGGRPLSREVLGIVERAIVEGARAPTLAEALEVGYAAFGQAACTAAAAEGIAAFRERRPADFARTG